MKLRKHITRRPKRAAIRRGLISLLVGCVLTIAVAWGFALFANTGPKLVDADATAPLYQQYKPRAWPPLDKLMIMQGIGVTSRFATGILYNDEDPDPIPGVNRWGRAIWCFIREDQCGPVVRTMTRFTSHLSGDSETMAKFGLQAQSQPDFPLLARGLAIPSWFPSRYHNRVLPLRPLWPGFVLSTLAFGLPIFGVLLTPSVRRGRRRRLGLCEVCKYPTDEFAVCPECGTPP